MKELAFLSLNTAEYKKQYFRGWGDISVWLVLDKRHEDLNPNLNTYLNKAEHSAAHL